MTKKSKAPTSKQRPKVLKKHKSHDHEMYDKQYGWDLDKHGRIDELAVKGAEKFWPKEKLVDVGRGKQAPRPFTSDGERMEFLHRLASERGSTFAEINGTR